MRYSHCIERINPRIKILIPNVLPNAENERTKSTIKWGNIMLVVLEFLTKGTVRDSVDGCRRRLH